MSRLMKKYLEKRHKLSVSLINSIEHGETETVKLNDVEEVIEADKCLTSNTIDVNDMTITYYDCPGAYIDLDGLKTRIREDGIGIYGVLSAIKLAGYTRVKLTAKRDLRYNNGDTVEFSDITVDSVESMSYVNFTHAETLRLLVSSDTVGPIVEYINRKISAKELYVTKAFSHGTEVVETTLLQSYLLEKIPLLRQLHINGMNSMPFLQPPNSELSYLHLDCCKFDFDTSEWNIDRFRLTMSSTSTHKITIGNQLEILELSCCYSKDLEECLKQTPIVLHSIPSVICLTGGKTYIYRVSGSKTGKFKRALFRR